MANAVRGNKIYVDATGSLTTRRTKIAYILFTPDAANDEIALREASSDVDCFYLRAATAKNTMVIDLSNAPAVFNNGIYVQTLTSGAKAVLITVQGS